MEMEKVFNAVKSKIIPSEHEKLKMQEIFNEVVSTLHKNAESKKINVKIEAGGSFAKLTWISGNSDIDIYVIFDNEEDTKRLREIVPKGFSIEHGTRVYFTGKVSNVEVQIVPLVKFSNISSVKNSIDLSILHKDYVLKHTDDKRRQDIILLKQFCRANGCYGSESYMHGFSGYVLELLIIYYGSIEQLFKAAMNWEVGEFIDIENLYKSKEEAIKSIGAKDNPLIIIDPTNKYRNVCGSLNLDNFAKFVFSVIRFMHNPSIDFFKLKDERKSIIKKSKQRGTRLYIFRSKIMPPNDVFLSKYRHNFDAFLSELGKNHIEFYDYHFIYGDKYVESFVEISATPQINSVRVLGPKIWVDEKFILEFMKEHNQVYLYHDNLAYDKKIKCMDINSKALDRLIFKIAKKFNLQS